MPQTLSHASISIKPNASVMIVLRSHLAPVVGEHILERSDFENPASARRFADSSIHHGPQTAIFGRTKKFHIRRRFRIGGSRILKMGSVPYRDSRICAHA